MPGMNLPETIERLNLASPWNYGSLSIPTHFSPVIDATISGNTTLTERINIFQNLTISGAVSLTGLAGGTIIIVRENLVINNASGVINCDALGGRGGGPGAVSEGGMGGGAWSSNIVSTRTQGAYITATTTWRAPKLQALMANGGAGRNTNAVGNAGSAFPNAAAYHGGSVGDLTDWALAAAMVELMIERSDDNATGGGIGGGGGGEGATNAAAGTAGTAGVIGAKGGNGSADTASGGGGSGFGGGGGGGGSGAAAGTTNAGGRGGGALLIICRTINNAGTIRCNGANGGARATGNAGGSGGGGGGGVLVLYEATAGSGLGTLQANGGTGGGAAGGTGSAGGNGGAGMARSAKIRAGY